MSKRTRKLRPPTWDVLLASDGQWYWHLQGGNGEIQTSARGYNSKRGAVRAFGRTRSNIVIAVRKGVHHV